MRMFDVMGRRRKRTPSLGTMFEYAFKALPQLAQTLTASLALLRIVLTIAAAFERFFQTLQLRRKSRKRIARRARTLRRYA